MSVHSRCSGDFHETTIFVDSPHRNPSTLSTDDDPAIRPVPNRHCFLSCFFAALGGGLHGYHNAIMGGIITRDDFLARFYPELLKAPRTNSIYCEYSSQRLALVTSSLFLASIIAESTGLPAYLSRRCGRRALMVMSGSFFLVGSVIQTAAVNVAMIIVSRCLLGVGLSCSTVSVLLYLSEVAPAKTRGKYNQLFQVQLTAFILLANLVNFAVDGVDDGWRISASLGIIPAIMFIIAGLVLTDSPSSLMERGKLIQGRQALEKFRLTDVSAKTEAQQIFASAERARKCTRPWATIVQSSHRPEFVLVFLSTLFQQFTGINFVIFYGPKLFVQLGKSTRTASVLTIVIAFVNHLSSYLSFFFVDRWGRRPLLIYAGIPIFLGLVGTGIILDVNISHAILPWMVLVFTCLFDVAYGTSWGPIGWLYPTEIQDLATRSAGITIASFVNVFFSFLLAQSALNLLCGLKSGIFFAFAGCVIVITISVYFLFPEPRGVSVEQSSSLYKLHPIWKKYHST